MRNKNENDLIDIQKMFQFKMHGIFEDPIRSTFENLTSLHALKQKKIIINDEDERL